LGHDHAEPEEHRVMFDLQGNLLEVWRQQGQVAP
jgi:probable rRNA maturation factor